MSVNIPLLRKAVEWAEAEAAKPRELCEWEQNFWHLRPDERADRLSVPARYNESPEEYYGKDAAAYQKAAECGTCYCIAGYVVAATGGEPNGWQTPTEAAILLNIEDHQADALFAPTNTIEDVRRIAEDLAGERL